MNACLLDANAADYDIDNNCHQAGEDDNDDDVND